MSFLKFIFGQKSTIHGSASFMSRRELKKLINKNKNKGLVVDGINRISEDLSFTGLLLAAPTGSGKTSRFVINNLLFAGTKQSFVIVDPSKEIEQICRQHLENIGFEILIFDPQNPSISCCYNSLHRVHTVTQAMKMAKIIVESAFPKSDSGDQFWNESAIGLISLLIQCTFGLPEEYKNLKFILRTLNKFGVDQEEVDQLMSNALDEDGWIQYKAFCAQQPKMKDSVISTAKTTLKALNDPNLVAVTSTETLHFEKLREKPVALFLQVEETSFKFYNFLLSIFFKQLFDFTIKGGNHKDGQALYYLLDEAGHYFIPNLQTYCNVIRKRRASISLILQDLQQLTELYGRSSASAIINGGMVNKLFFGGLSIETCEMLERSLGRQTILHEERGYSLLDKDSPSRTSEIARSLMTAEEIRTMENQAIFLSGPKKPVLLNMTPWYKIKELIKRTQKS